MSLQFTFWGVRGSLPCPGNAYSKYGGNTSCIEVTTPESRFILDAGSGIRQLGDKILQERKNKQNKQNLAILFSHTHWDHINGFPFFKPLYIPDITCKIMAGSLTQQGGIKNALSKQMQPPFFPVGIEVLTAQTQFHDFQAGDEFKLFDANIRTTPLNHPNGATGYRIDYNKNSICYITDTEHFQDKIDNNILKLIDNADAVIYDCAYTDEEYKNKIGWGHSTWNEGLKLCLKANVKQFYIFHHDPSHDDQFMDNVAQQAKEKSPICNIATEGITHTLNS